MRFLLFFSLNHKSNINNKSIFNIWNMNRFSHNYKLNKNLFSINIKIFRRKLSYVCTKIFLHKQFSKKKKKKKISNSIFQKFVSYIIYHFLLQLLHRKVLFDKSWRTNNIAYKLSSCRIWNQKVCIIIKIIIYINNYNFKNIGYKSSLYSGKNNIALLWLPKIKQLIGLICFKFLTHRLPGLRALDRHLYGQAHKIIGYLVTYR